MTADEILKHEGRRHGCEIAEMPLVQKEFNQRSGRFSAQRHGYQMLGSIARKPTFYCAEASARCLMV